MYAIGITYVSPQHSPQHINVFYDVNSIIIISHFRQILWFHINHIKFLPVTSEGVWVPAIFKVQIRIVFRFLCFILP